MTTKRISEMEHAIGRELDDDVLDMPTRKVSAVAGVDFGDGVSEHAIEALHCFGEHRRDLLCRDWSPAVWRETFNAAMMECGCEKKVVENIYHAIRRGWRNFHFERRD